MLCFTYLQVGLIGFFIGLQNFLSKCQSQVSLLILRIQLDTLLSIRYGKPIALDFNVRK